MKQIYMCTINHWWKLQNEEFSEYNFWIILGFELIIYSWLIQNWAVSRGLWNFFGDVKLLTVINELSFYSTFWYYTVERIQLKYRSMFPSKHIVQKFWILYTIGIIISLNDSDEFLLLHLVTNFFLSTQILSRKWRFCRTNDINFLAW